MCQCPRVKGLRPLCSTLVFGVLEGWGRQSVSARQRATGQFIRRHMFTRRRIRGFKRWNWGPERLKKEQKEEDVWMEGWPHGGIYFWVCDVKAFSMHRTMQELEQLLELCCRRLPLCSEAARPLTARSPARHVSQQWSVCRWPFLLEPCQTIFSGLEGNKKQVYRMLMTHNKG